MKRIGNSILIFSILLVVGGLLGACNSKKEGQNDNIAKEPAPTVEKETATRIYTDYKGHEVKIPISPERLIYHGENFGDLLPLGVSAVGGAYNWISNHVFENQIKNVDDIGFPINLEKVLELEPDIIILGDTDEKVYDQLSKIAPTIVFDTFASVDKRILELGDILGKKQEATAWLTDYTRKEEAMWKQLVNDGTIKPGETASVFTYYPGDRLFVMAITGLSQVLYHPDGFNPGAKIQPILDAEKGFEEVSLELLPEFAGDRIFILTPETDEAKQSTQDMIDSPMWKNLPAVKKGNVYTLDIVESSSDATTREWLLGELPSILKK